jgi:addiction module HigA family antidote
MLRRAAFFVNIIDLHIVQCTRRKRTPVFNLLLYIAKEEGMITIFDPVHPGEFIREMYMEPFEIHAADLADRLDVSPSTLSRILNGKTDLSVEMALRLSKVLGRSAESWVSMQAQYSLSKMRTALETKLHELSPMALC